MMKIANLKKKYNRNVGLKGPSIVNFLKYPSHRKDEFSIFKPLKTDISNFKFIFRTSLVHFIKSS